VSNTTRPVVIDVGCGRGEILESIQRTTPAARCIGIDGVSGPAWDARRDLEFVLFDLEGTEAEPAALDALRNSADVVVCSEVIEHMDDERHALDLIQRLLAPSGFVILTAPGGPIAHIDRHFGHRRHYRREMLRSLLQDRGFDLRLHYSSGFPMFGLYRLGLLIGGAALSRRVASPSRSQPLALTRVIFSIFKLLFLIPSPRRLGWQHFVVATKA